MQYKKKTLNKIKIIGGKYKNKIIQFDYLDSKDSNIALRPTSNRARETLFNWLMHDVSNSSCIDLFPGSGALSFEAISRGARHVTLIEMSKSVYNSLLKIQQTFPKELDKINIENNNSLEYINNNNKHTPYNIAFIDPPFDIINTQLISHLISKLSDNNYIDQNSLIYIESDKDLENIITTNNLEILKNKKVSSVYIYLCCMK